MKLKAITQDTVTVEMTPREMSELVEAHDMAVDWLIDDMNEITKEDIKHHRKHSRFWLSVLVTCNNAPWK